MSFDPALTTDRDRMRDALDDISDAAPFVPDATYDAYLADAGGDWRYAAAALARRLASRALNSPSSFSLPGDISVSWNDRAAAWLKIAAALEAEATRLALSTRSGMWTAEVARGDLDTDSAEYSIELRRR